MSRQAQAEREKQARIILGSAEAAIVGVEAAMTYADHPTALQLRAMNIIYETTKERGATILIPTSMVDSMNPVVALALAGQQTAPQKTSGPLPLSANEGKERVAAPQTAGTQTAAALLEVWMWKHLGKVVVAKCDSRGGTLPKRILSYLAARAASLRRVGRELFCSEF